MSDVDAWAGAWAKTGRSDPSDPQRVTHWLALPEHLADTAAVAGRLVDDWVSPLVLRRIERAVGGDRAAVRGLVGWLAAVHDVGKASPAFAVQVRELADAMRPRGLVADPALASDPQRSRIRHEQVGELAVMSWLADELGFRWDGPAAQLGAVVGAHHGVPPGDDDLMQAEGRPDLMGSGAWERARVGLLGWATDLVGGPDLLRPLAHSTLDLPTQVLLAGIVIVADWIASNPDFFPLRPVHTAHEPVARPDPRETARRAAAGWGQLDLPDRWCPAPIDDPHAAFAQRFGREPGSARPVQVAAVEVATAADRPGLVIVEAPMGEGKTEAALLAAEALAARSGADGCFVALPTRATSDAMFSRVLRWLERVPGRPAGVSVTLAHGTAALNDTYRGLMRAAHVSCVGEGGADEAAVAHYWLRGRRKGPLAQFVVGTIDQVLYAGLKSRHLMLRHLALAGKVVVIDEVHAYDLYMSTYLDQVLHWLGAYGTPVVLLSATLPSPRRRQLLDAYRSGQGGTAPEPTDTGGYPLISASDAAPRPVPASGAEVAVQLEHSVDDLDVLVGLLRERLAGGGCAVVVRNTVARVQETADRLLAEFGADQVTVAHSRFLACDRARIDRELLARFGPPGAGVTRPHRHVVVASQVVEQSLDVDFDLMVTDLAPVDLVLQRLGRLHRHRRERPGGLSAPRCVLVGVEDWALAPVRAVAGSRRVYGEHTLLRSAALLAGRAAVALPTDIVELVELGYGDADIGPEAWRPAMSAAALADRQRAVQRRAAARTFLLGGTGKPTATLDGWVRAGVGDAEDDRRAAAQVRDGAETLEVLVVQRDRDGGLLTPDWIERGAARQLPLDERVPDELARIVASCALRLPIAMSVPGPVGDGVIAALERDHFASFHQHPLLGGQLVLVLDAERSAELHHRDVAFRLTYDPRRGLHHERI